MTRVQNTNKYSLQRGDGIDSRARLPRLSQLKPSKQIEKIWCIARSTWLHIYMNIHKQPLGFSDCAYMLSTAHMCCQLRIYAVDCAYILSIAHICYQLRMYAVNCAYMLSTAHVCCQLRIYAVDCAYILSIANICYQLRMYAVNCAYMLSTAHVCCRPRIYPVDCAYILSITHVCCQLRQLRQLRWCIYTVNYADAYILSCKSCLGYK